MYTEKTFISSEVRDHFSKEILEIYNALDIGEESMILRPNIQTALGKPLGCGLVNSV